MKSRIILAAAALSLIALPGLGHADRGDRGNRGHRARPAQFGGGGHARPQRRATRPSRQAVRHRRAIRPTRQMAHQSRRAIRDHRGYARGSVNRRAVRRDGRVYRGDNRSYLRGDRRGYRSARGYDRPVRRAYRAGRRFDRDVSYRRGYRDDRYSRRLDRSYRRWRRTGYSVAYRPYLDYGYQLVSWWNPTLGVYEDVYFDPATGLYYRYDRAGQVYFQIDWY